MLYTSEIGQQVCIFYKSHFPYYVYILFIQHFNELAVNSKKTVSFSNTEIVD